jgi:hypothetical protein
MLVPEEEKRKTPPISILSNVNTYLKSFTQATNLSAALEKYFLSMLLEQPLHVNCNPFL